MSKENKEDKGNENKDFDHEEMGKRMEDEMCGRQQRWTSAGGQVTEKARQAEGSVHISCR